MLTLPIQAGRKYLRRDGAVVGVTVVSEAQFWTSDAEVAQGYRDDGRAGRLTGDHRKDLVADYVEPVKAQGHPHAAILRAIADGEQIQHRRPGEEYIDLCANEALAVLLTGLPDRLRIKPKTIRIGEFEVPEPLRKPPKFGTPVFLTNVFAPGFRHESTWSDRQVEAQWLASGMYHLTSEAAVLHAKALLSLTEQKQQ